MTRKDILILLFASLFISNAFAEEPLKVSQGKTIFVQLPGSGKPAGITSMSGFGISLLCTSEFCQAVIAAPTDMKPGNHPLNLDITNPDIPPELYETEIQVTKGSFKEESITLPDAYVTFTPSVRKRVKQEESLLRALLGRRSAPEEMEQPFAVPVNGAVTATFGARRRVNGKPPSAHRAVDLRCSSGSPIRASQSGTVSLTASFYLNGNLVILNHGDALFSSYSHLSRITVNHGNRVKQGDIIGLCGSTGRSTGPHLHYAIIVGNVAVDPLAFTNATADLFTDEEESP